MNQDELARGIRDIFEEVFIRRGHNGVGMISPSAIDKALKEQVKDLEKINIRLLKELKTMKKDAGDKVVLAEEERTIAELQERVKLMKEDNESLQEQLKDLNLEIEETEDRRKREITNLTKKNQAAEEKAKVAKAKTALTEVYRKQVTVLEETVEALEQQVRGLMTDLESKTKETADILAQVKQDEKNQEQVINDLIKERDQLRAAVAQYTRRDNDLTSRINLPGPPPVMPENVVPPPPPLPVPKGPSSSKVTRTAVESSSNIDKAIEKNDSVRNAIPPADALQGSMTEILQKSAEMAKRREKENADGNSNSNILEEMMLWTHQLVEEDMGCLDDYPIDICANCTGKAYLKIHSIDTGISYCSDACCSEYEKGYQPPDVDLDEEHKAVETVIDVNLENYDVDESYGSPSLDEKESLLS